MRFSLTRGEPVFLPIGNLHPQLAHLLSLRRVLGVRNSAHTLVKILQPPQWSRRKWRLA